jgi:hypothetical protein
MVEALVGLPFGDEGDQEDVNDEKTRAPTR